MSDAAPRRDGGPPRGGRARAPGNLEADLTSFVGRTAELAAVGAQLARTRLLTLSGSGGCGKTRLAAEAARAARPAHPDGVWWVELAPLADPALVAPALAAALGVRPRAGGDDLGAAIEHLLERRALVVLDNCEHVIGEAARIAETVARRCTGVTIMTTSREPLRVGGETDWRVPPLALEPGDGEAPVCDAVRLFAERAAAVRPGLRLDGTSASAVERICRELDGIPLAIELAAARTGLLSPEQIAASLSDRFGLLSAGSRTALPRQRTLRASVDWSHDLLGEHERILLRRLGVFAGGFTLATARRVCAGEGLDDADVLGVLGSLVAKSLVQADERGRAVRYSMLATIRVYALERLEAAGETGRLRDRHRDAHLELAARTAPALMTPGQAEALETLDDETANLEQALAHAARTDPPAALALCEALTLWWRLRASFTRAAAGFARALDAAAGRPAADRARVLWARSYLLVFSGDLAAAARAAEEALEAATQGGDERTVARSLTVLGKCELMREPPTVCRPRLRRAHAMAHAGGDDLCLMHAAHALAFSHLFQDDAEPARALLNAVLPVVERTGHHEFLANHWSAVGWARRLEGDLPAARQALERATAVARAVGDTVTEAGAAAFLADVETDAGRPRAALERLVPVHGRALARGAGFLLPWARCAIARAEAADGRLADARASFGAVIGEGAGGVLHALCGAWTGLAETLRLHGDRGAARDAAERALALADRLGSGWLCAQAGLVLGRVAAAEGRWTDAAHGHQEALGALGRHGHRLGVPAALESLAEVAAGTGREGDAARLLGAAGRVRADLGLVAWRDRRAELDALAARLGDALGAAQMARARAAGAALPTREALAWVRRARGVRGRPARGWESLTPTELEVVRHVAAGLTNPQIGERMFISRSTVKAHLAHVYAKLGLHSRAELAREAGGRPELAGRAA